MNDDISINNQKGIALVMSLIITLVVFLLVGSTLYVLLQSTGMSGAGKKYATASDAADGAVHVLIDTINLGMKGGTGLISTGIFQSGSVCSNTNLYTLQDAIKTQNSPCTVQLNLPAEVSGSYTATVSVTMLYSMTIPGGRIEFARGGGVGSTAIFYRITTTVVGPGPDHATAENSVLYRLVG